MTDVTDPTAAAPESTRAPAPLRTRFRPLAGPTAKNAVREVLGGVTLLAIAIPLNIGSAQIAGLPATAGLCALVVPSVLYALTESSRQLIASPDADRDLFADTTSFEEAVERAVHDTGATHAVLELEAVTDVDVTGAESGETVQAFLTAHGADLALSRVRPGIRERLQHLELLDGVRLFDTNREAIMALQTHQTGSDHGRR